MLTFLRNAFGAALIALAVVPANAADKPYQNGALAQAAIKLEAQIRQDTGTVTKSVATLGREADVAFRKRDFRTGMMVLGQMVTVAPDDAAIWLRLARTVREIKPRNARERSFLLDRTSATAYIAYQRARSGNIEADSLAILGRTFADRQQWRRALDTMRLSLGLRETASLRGEYERLRLAHGFRLLNYTVDSDAMSPRVCFQFSEKLPGKRTDLSPYVAVVGQDRPAISTTDRQLCVEGLKHGERYAITLRVGLPSTVHETLARTTEFTIFVRDRKPFVRFSGKAYVLPRSGQHGIPVLSVNSTTIKLTIYRVGDRNLMNAVLGYDFQRNLGGYEAQRLANERGTKIWTGELAVEPKLNTEVTTAFPVAQAVKDLKPGIYAMTAVPKEAPGNDYDARATQWFIVSDLGLTAYSTHEGIDVFVRSLASAEPDGQVAVRLMARDNEVLATALTDKTGHLHFAAGLTRGEGGQAPALLIASTKGDYAFLSLKVPPFDLSDRGVAGRALPVGLDAFVYTERGVYRSGETVHVTVLLRDARGIAATGSPITVVMHRPDGVEYRRAVVNDEGLGGRSWNVPLVASAMTGTWRVAAYTDPRRPPIGDTTFMVEDYVPDRIEFGLATAAKTISPKAPARLVVDGRFLYGAPASKLALSGAVIVDAVTDRDGFPGYAFGLADDEVTPVRQGLKDLPATDDAGKASFDVALDNIPDSTRPLQAKITIAMADSGGRAVERDLTLPVTPDAPMIGVKPDFNGRSLADGANADFDVVTVMPDGQTVARQGLQYQLLKIVTSYQWYRQDGQWQFEPVKHTERVANGTLDVAADKPGHLSLPVKWGRYRLEVHIGDSNGPITSLDFDAGFYAEASADTPDLLEIALDKKDYKPGDALEVAVTARSAGRLTLDVFTDRLVANQSEDVKAGTMHLLIPVGAEWGTGAYLVATLHRPLDVQRKRMPGRAIGVQWFSIDRSAHTLAMRMDLPKLLRPNSTLDVPVHVAGLKAGEEARIVVAAVDVGILNLTNYKPPAPDDYYLGQRRLTADIRDLYGQLIDGMQGVTGRIRSGGDTGGELTGRPPTQAPLALYSGIVKVGADGMAHVRFEIPTFSGTVRVMAVGWSQDRVGKSVGDVEVRDPVVLTATLPRFLRTGDRGTVQLVFDNFEGAAGNYNVVVSGEGAVKIDDDTAHKLTLASKQRGRVLVPISAAGAGTSKIDVSVSGPNGFTLDRAYALNVRPATQTVTRRKVQALTKGQTLTLDRDMFADFVPGTGDASLSVTVSTSLDAAALLHALDTYPFACSEQLTSRAIAMLYLDELGNEAQLAVEGGIKPRIRDAIDRLMAREDPNGSFGLWSVGGNDVWLDAYVTDFLTRARERGDKVPAIGFKLALDYLRNYVATAPEPTKNGGADLAYALYVLARNGEAPIGDLRYIADVQLNKFVTPTARAQIGAALGMIGDTARADRVFNAALAALPVKPTLVNFNSGRADYGSPLRDAAALVALAAEGHAPARIIDTAMARVDAARAEFSATSTQEDAWLVLAARALSERIRSISLSLDGARHVGALYRGFEAAALTRAFNVTNVGAGTVQAVVSVSGAPIKPEPPADHGFKIERDYYTLDGQQADPSHATQNQRFVVLLKVTELQPQFGRVILADYLPAGFEIDNPHLVSSGDSGKLPWLTDTATPVHAGFRDDRFTAAFERNKNSAPVFSVAYVVRAVSPGHYVLPQAFVEDMYRPDRFGRTATGTVDIMAAK